MRVMLLIAALMAGACSPSGATGTSAASTTTSLPATTTTSATTPLPPPVPGDPAGLLVLTGRLIDGTGADPVPDGLVAIEGDTIVAAGPASLFSIPPGVEVVDLPDATIMPGFINAHVHNAYDLSNLQVWAHAGVTTVRDLGARWDGSADYFYLAGYYTDNVAQAARVIPAGPLVTVPMGYPIAGNRFASLTVESPEDAGNAIERLIEDGARVIKITLTVGGPPTLSLDEVTAIVEAAHRHGVPVSVHATDAASLRLALDGGVDDIAHSITDRLPDSLIERMVEDDVSLVPTLAIQEGRGAANLRRFVAAGGRVALGNDAGFLRGVLIGMPMNEIDAMWEAGLTSMEIITAATGNAAYVCRIDETLGTLEAGKLADVLVVSGNPLDDLGALEDVLMVIRGGQIIRDDF